MNTENKSILEQANAAVSNGDYEVFLSFCTDSTQWTFVGDQILTGKDEVRRYMAEVYTEPPKFLVEQMISEGNYVTAIGTIRLKNKEGKTINYSYCDVWRFRDGKMDELKAFVIENR